ncbi:hypothetical protein [Clostridium sp. C2-6-12]|nr:hypothetical protein [Clostridium sp. C2-6-12]
MKVRENETVLFTNFIRQMYIEKLREEVKRKKGLRLKFIDFNP